MNCMSRSRVMMSNMSHVTIMSRDNQERRDRNIYIFYLQTHHLNNSKVGTKTELITRFCLMSNLEILRLVSILWVNQTRSLFNTNKLGGQNDIYTFAKLDAQKLCNNK